MKKPSNLSESLSRIWDVFDAFQRIDIEYYRRWRHKRERDVVKNRFRYRVQLMRLAKRTEGEVA
jgi:hypothetical protein